MFYLLSIIFYRGRGEVLKMNDWRDKDESDNKKNKS